MKRVLAEATISISELKKNPMSIMRQAEGFPVAVLNHNQPAFYCVPAETYEWLMDKLEDVELRKIVTERQNDSEVEVDLDEL